MAGTFEGKCKKLLFLGHYLEEHPHDSKKDFFQLGELLFSQSPQIGGGELFAGLKQNFDLRNLEKLLVIWEQKLGISRKDGKWIQRDNFQPREKTLPLILCLDHIRSAYNVGNIIRTAYALGVEEILFYGYTPLPDQNSVKKSSLGCEKFLPWKKISIEDLNTYRDKYRFCALETAPEARELGELKGENPTLFFLGNERWGLSPEIMESVDEKYMISMMGGKASLNVGCCASILIHHFTTSFK